MKNVLFYFAFAASLLGSCSKSSSTNSNPPAVIKDDNGCMARVPVDRLPFTVTTSDSLAAIAIFQSNGVSYSKLYFTSYIADTVVGIPNKHFVIVKAYQFLNGLPVLRTIVYSFTNGVFQDASDTLLATTTLDAVPSLRLSQVRWLYVQQLLTNTQPVSMANYKDSCITATFCYYNISPSPAPVSLVKAWIVHPAGNEYPFAIFKDDGTMLIFDNGIRTL